jgi:hypothetical protein
VPDGEAAGVEPGVLAGEAADELDGVGLVLLTTGDGLLQEVASRMAAASRPPPLMSGAT